MAKRERVVTKIQGVLVMDIIDGINIINICDWLDATFKYEKEHDYEETGRILRIWCAANDATYYGRPRENFFMREAVELAKKDGKETVIVEDLS